MIRETKVAGERGDDRDAAEAPSSAYLAQETFERERERIFGTEWFCAGREDLGSPRPLTTSADRRLALLSVLIGGFALLAKIGVYLIARRAPQLLLLVALLDWGATLLAVFAILVARRPVRRIDNTSDKRGVMMAQVGLMLGWANIAYVVFSIVTWPIRQVTNNIPH